MIGSVTIAGADVDTVESVFAEMDRKGLSPNYKRQALKALSSMFDYAVRKRVLAYNPVRLVDPIAGTVQRQTKVPEVDEVKRILAELAAPVVTTERTKGRPRNEAEERERVRVLCLVMAHAGLRISEALGLQWSDVDLEHRRITLVGKGRKRRTIPVTRSLSTELSGVASTVVQGADVRGLVGHIQRLRHSHRGWFALDGAQPGSAPAGTSPNRAWSGPALDAESQRHDHDRRGS